MSAKPGAYDDLAAVYATEVSPIARGILLTPRRCGEALTFDRFNRRRYSSEHLEASATGDGEAIYAAELLPLVDAPPRPAGSGRKSPEDIRRAAHRGGAANKARWARIKALKEAA